MPGVTREQIDRAKEWDLLSYLQTYEPGELTKKRPTDKEYRTKTHDSLVISNGRWNWTTRGFGGKTALDYLIKVRGMEFVEAVRTLNDGRAAPSLSQPVTRPPEQPRAFALPAGKEAPGTTEGLCAAGGEPLRHRRRVVFAAPGDRFGDHQPVHTGRYLL